MAEILYELLMHRQLHFLIILFRKIKILTDKTSHSMGELIFLRILNYILNY